VRFNQNDHNRGRAASDRKQNGLYEACKVGMY
jgi:hypothetical protein